MVWSEEGITLSDRLQVMADKVEVGQSVADIGADHGYLGLYLYDRGISPHAVLTDISEASLAKAKTAAGAAQFGNDVSFRVGDGLSVLEPGEVDVVVIAGMGGLLIRDILSADVDKTRSFGKFVLQPRTSSGPLRKWLLEADFAILNEDIVEEGDFLPEIITVAPMDGSEGEILNFDYFEYEEVLAKANGQIVDLASGIRNSLVDTADKSSETVGEPEEYPEDLPGEDSIHFSVPVWILNASGPVMRYLDRRIARQEDVLAGLGRAKTPDETAIEAAKYNIDYLKKLREIRMIMEQMDLNDPRAQ